jgi:hypothetical protein
MQIIYTNNEKKIINTGAILYEGRRDFIIENENENEIKSIELYYNNNLINYTLLNENEYENEYQLSNKFRLNIIKTINNLINDPLVINTANNELIMNNLYNTIEKLINFWETIIGKDVNINNDNIYLKQNVYIINHNYRGITRSDIITHTENENKILFKKDDPYFKQNIFYFYDKTQNLTMYYNAQDYNYLGYKEQGKDYTRVYGTGASLEVKLAIKNKCFEL